MKQYILMKDNREVGRRRLNEDKKDFLESKGLVLVEVPELPTTSTNGTKRYILINDNKVIAQKYYDEEMVALLEQSGSILIETPETLNVKSGNLIYVDGQIVDQTPLKAEMKALLDLLASTDYLVIRKMESDVDYSQEIKDQRQAARDRISVIRDSLVV